MLPKENRLTKQDEFSTILKSGRRLKSRFLVVSILAKSNALRVGLVVSKRVSKKAVVRNRIRRVIYHILHDLQVRSVLKDAEAVMLVTRIPEGKMYDEFKQDIEKCLASWYS